MREYVVSLVKGIDYDQFWNEIENESPTDGFIPSRRVEIINNRDGSLRSCHYELTDDEAEKLRQDPRVYCVEIPADQRQDITIGFRATQSANFTKPSLSNSSYPSSGNNTNWGLIRNSNATNVYGVGTTTVLNYEYQADGTGVDVVIQDSGLQVDHPEFTDSNGDSRVQQIDWYTASGLSGSQSANHYRDYNGHGTHVAGIAAGKTYGWAKNAKIYSVKVNGLEGAGDSGNGISVTDCFDVIKLWHRNKPIDSTLGRKRPTVVNMSWGYSSTYNNIIGGNYRGTPWTGVTYDTSKGMIGTNRCPVRVSSIDVDLEELIDEGVIVCVAAGNETHKIDLTGGLDYNNYWTSSVYGDIYYHRGSSPYSNDAIIVGALNVTPYDASTDQKSWFSNAGPGVDIFAAGDQIMSSTSNTNEMSGVAYHLNSSYKQVNLPGTSMASPQIAGIAACYLEKNLTATPSQFKTWLLNNATSGIYSTGLSNDYTNVHSQYGGTTKVAYSYTAAGSNATIGIPVFSGNNGHANVTFKRLPPPVLGNFPNFGFETGLAGWTVVDKQIHFRNTQCLGAQPSVLANYKTPNDPTPQQNGSPGALTIVPDGQFSHRLEKIDMPPGGAGQTQCVRLTFNGYSPVYAGSVVYGPAIYSNVSASLAAGDQVKFWFKGIQGGDKYSVYAYLVEQNTGLYLEILDEMQTTGMPDQWREVTYTVPSGKDGDYAFVFICGSWDYTFGTYVGGELLVDTIRIIKV